MTILDGVAVQATRVRPRDRGAALARAWRWVWMRGSIHALLLVAVAGCMYPLVWMFMTSIKTDEELAQSDDVPSLPVFRDHSPYVRDEPAILTPDDVDPTRFRELLPRLRETAAELTRAALPTPVPPAVDGAAWASSAAVALVSRTIIQLPRQTWHDGDDVVSEKVRAL